MDKEYFMNQLERIADEAYCQAFDKVQDKDHVLTFMTMKGPKLFSSLETKEELDFAIESILTTIRTIGDRVKSEKLIAEIKQNVPKRSILHQIFNKIAGE